MNYLPAISITFLGFVVLIVECNVVQLQNSKFNFNSIKYKRISSLLNRNK